MLGYYGKAGKLTYANVIFAVFGMFYALNENITVAMICLMLAGVCDMFDGTVANMMERTEREKNYGVQIDSLADLVSFGVFPALIGYSLGMDNFSYMFILAIYILAALIRLAYFNVIEMDLEEPRGYFEGLPVTSVALIIPILYFLSVMFNFSLLLIYTVLLIVLSISFVSKFKVPKPSLRHMIIFCLIGMPIATILIVKHLLG